MARVSKSKSSSSDTSGESNQASASSENAAQRELEKLIFERQAQVAKGLANPRRMEILHLLYSSPEPLDTVALLEATGISKTNLSQQMSVLMAAGLVEALREAGGREGSRVRYRCTTPKVGQACDLLREALLERMEFEGELARRRKR